MIPGMMFPACRCVGRWGEGSMTVTRATSTHARRRYDKASGPESTCGASSHDRSPARATRTMSYRAPVTPGQPSHLSSRREICATRAGGIRQPCLRFCRRTLREVEAGGRQEEAQINPRICVHCRPGTSWIRIDIAGSRPKVAAVLSTKVWKAVLSARTELKSCAECGMVSLSKTSDGP